MTAQTKTIPVYIYPDADALGTGMAAIIINGIKEAASSRRQYLLGCPGGRSAASTYISIGRLAAKQNIDMSQTVIVMMDNYVFAENNTYVHCPDDAHYSCMRFALDHIRDVINADLSEHNKIKNENIWIPDPADPDGYETKIRDAGGIDLFIVASGASDGHAAFNPPGSERTSTTRIIELAQTTREDNLGTFPEFNSLDDVPEYGVSVGVDTIIDCSRKVACVIHGTHKNQAVKEMAAREAFDPQWPVSLIYDAETIGLFVDEAAASNIDFNSNNILRIP